MFPQLSENTANTVYWLGWFLVLASAMMGLAGSALGFWGDKERERYSDLRLSDNEKQIEVAKAQAAVANDSAKKSELALEQLRLGLTSRLKRLIDGNFEETLKGKPYGTAKIWYVAEDEDALILARFMWGFLYQAGWRGGDPTTIPASLSKAPDSTLFMAASGGMSGGNGIVLRCSKLSNYRDEHQPIGSLMKSFKDAGLEVGLVPGDFLESVGIKDEISEALAKDQVLIVIGRKY